MFVKDSLPHREELEGNGFVFTMDKSPVLLIQRGFFPEEVIFDRNGVLVASVATKKD